MNPQELVNDVKDIKTTLDKIEKRGVPATAKQLEAINSRPIELDSKSFANYVKDDLKDVLPNSEAVKNLFADFIEQMREETNDCVKRINKSVEHIPRKVSVTGDIYGFTTTKAALIYGAILVTTFFGSWSICTYYRDQAQETVIYQQAQEIARERNYYYSQIQNYKRNNFKYAKLFPEYKN